mgnify:CR=1 FL=1
MPADSCQSSARVVAKKDERVFSMQLGKFSKTSRILYRDRILYLMVLPAFLLTFLFHYCPLFGWVIAFKNYTPGLSMFKAPGAGLSHFKTFFVDSTDYLYVFKNTLSINFTSLIVGIGSAFLLAILLREIRFFWFARTIQSVTFVPYFISWVITYAIIYALFSVQTGAVNVTLLKMGLIDQGLNVMGETQYAWGLIVGMNVWRYIGYNSVIFISAAAGIAEELYEAAEIDGANRLGKVWHITIPSLVPTLVVLLVINTGWLLNSNFEQFYLFTNPTNMEKMEVFDMYIYKYGFQLMNYSYATAVGVIRTVVSLSLIVFVNWTSKRLSGKSIF